MRGIYAQERKRNEEIWWMKVIFFSYCANIKLEVMEDVCSKLL